MRAEGYAVESICRVLRDAQVVDAVRDIAWTTDAQGRRKLAPEGLSGRRKMPAYLRRVGVRCFRRRGDRAMRTLGLSGVRRDKGIRTTITAKDGIRGPVSVPV